MCTRDVPGCSKGTVLSGGSALGRHSRALLKCTVDRNATLVVITWGLEQFTALVRDGGLLRLYTGAPGRGRPTPQPPDCHRVFHTLVTTPALLEIIHAAFSKFYSVSKPGKEKTAAQLKNLVQMGSALQAIPIVK